MSRAGRLARAIANAFLDAPWNRRELVARVAEVFGGERPWMAKLARSALRAFPRPPSDARDLLAARLRRAGAFADLLEERCHPIAWATPTPAMGRARWPVPPLATIAELAAFLEVDPDALEILADRRGISRRGDERGRHYTYRWVPKRDGHRLLEAPKLRLKRVQRCLLDTILAHVPPHDAAYAYRRGRSVASFARVHVGRDVVVRVDLEAFFPSITAGRVYGIFRAAGYPEEVARTLVALTTHATPPDVVAAAPRIASSLELRARMLQRLRTLHLVQGAPTSPALANLAAWSLDVRLEALARSIDARYGRYADDLVFSGDARVVAVLPTMEAIARDEGFLVNAEKRRVMRRSVRQSVSSVVVNEKTSLPRVELDRLRAILHNAARTSGAEQNRGDHPDFRAHLLGRIAWVTQLDAEKGARLRATFDRIAW